MSVRLLWQGGILFLVTFVLTVLFELRLIPWLRRHHAGQPILEIGPAWHMTKKGTPTLGGLGFILALVLTFALFVLFRVWRGEGIPTELLLVVCFALFCASIGLFDDWKKLQRKQNQGLTAVQKYALQLLASTAFLLLAKALVGLQSAVVLPFVGMRLELGVWYYPLAILYLTGLVNALNLTDGVDGLLSCTTAVLALFLVLLGSFEYSENAVTAGALLLGAVLGFLCFNRHPARVFMGDTGSLFLGAMVGGYGILSPSPLALLLACGVFVAEAVSVIAQVVYFKCTKGKRLFLMAPLHHHFEKLGWSEWRVVAVFSLVGTVFAVLALLGR